MVIKTVSMLEYLEECAASPNWNPGAPAPVTLGDALEVYRERCELRERLTAEHQHSGELSNRIEFLENRLHALQNAASALGADYTDAATCARFGNPL